MKKADRRRLRPFGLGSLTYEKDRRMWQAVITLRNIPLRQRFETMTEADDWLNAIAAKKIDAPKKFVEDFVDFYRKKMNYNPEEFVAYLEKKEKKA